MLRVFTCLLIMGFCWGTFVRAQDPPLTKKQREALVDGRDRVGRAAVKYRDGDFVAAGEQLTQAVELFQTTLAAMEAEQRERTIDKMKSLIGNMRTAHAMLQLEGVDLPPIRIGDGTRWWEPIRAGNVQAAIEQADAPEKQVDEPEASSAKSPNTETVATSMGVASEMKPAIETRVVNPDKISFVGDVAPILLANCNGCHLDTNRIRGGLRMDSFAGLLRGGDEGDVVDAGSGADSTLVMRMRGEGGDLMPAGGRPAVPEEQIQLISDWIDQGAEFDGDRPATPLRRAVLQSWASGATMEQMSRRRAEESEKLIRLMTGPGNRVESVSSDHFLVMGPVYEDELERIGKVADAQVKSILALIPPSRDRSGQAYFGGRATVFVLPRGYDYGEFVRMAEKRSVPPAWTGHFRDDTINPYVAVIGSSDLDNEAIRDRLASPLIALAMATRGADVPEWLSRGVGEAWANARVRKLTRGQRQQQAEQTREAVVATKDAKMFLEDRLPAQQSDALATAIANAMTDGARRRAFGSLVRNLNEDEAFADSFTAAYGVTPEVFINAFLKSLRQ